MPPTRRSLGGFLDGVGIGRNDPDLNPFLRAELPVLQELLGAIPTLDGPIVRRADGPLPPATAFPVDATLGMEGTPQSGTGQTALLTGVDAPQEFGRHFGPWVPTTLRDVVREQSFLREAVDRGASAAFLNAYPVGWPGPKGGRRMAGPPVAAKGAGLLTRTHEHIARSEAVASEILNDGWIERLGFSDLPRPTAEEAGRTLARLAADFDVSLYAHYSTDSAGHRGGMDGAIAALERVDAFLGGIADALPAHLDVLVCSDHGNIEEVGGGHTNHPSLGLLIGEAAVDFNSSRIPDLTRIPGFVLSYVG